MVEKGSSIPVSDVDNDVEKHVLALSRRMPQLAMSARPWRSLPRFNAKDKRSSAWGKNRILQMSKLWRRSI
jgi:hypothetical protein